MEYGGTEQYFGRGNVKNTEMGKRIRRLAAEKSSQSGDSLSAPRKIDKTKKLIAFSFDDGPARQNTDKVAKALAKNHVRATFLCLDRMFPIIRSL